MKSRQLKCAAIFLCFLCLSSVFIFLSLDKYYSNRGNLDRRNTIRNTWLKLSTPDSKHIFVIGGAHIEYDSAKVQAEAQQHGDVLLLPNTNDSYESLTSKVLHAFTYLKEFWKFEYLLKCDDDSFVRVSDIVSELRTRFHHINNLYWGFFHGSAHVKKKGRWKETKWILCDRYLPYALGGGYILSHSLIQFIADNRRYLLLFQTEDVAVGTWLAPVNVTRIHDPRFDTEYISRGCSNSYLITHKHDLMNMRYFYTTLKNTDNLCDAEYKLRLSYLYNWDVEPSKCCIRRNTSIP